MNVAEASASVIKWPARHDANQRKCKLYEAATSVSIKSEEIHD